MKKTHRAFTLTEMLVAMAVSALLIVLFARMVNSAATATSISNKRMDVNSEIRPLFNRIAVDLSQMIKRNDVSYYVKISSNAEPGNDLLSFFSLVDGFYPNSSSTAEAKQPQTSIVSYRINTNYQFERMAKSLPFAGQSTQTPLVFGSTYTLVTEWPTAISSTSSDTDYAIAGTDVFRFEYYYLLKTTGATSDSPWTSMSQVKMTDVAAIAIAMATIDPKSRKLLSSTDLATLSLAMNDYTSSMGTTGLLVQWQSALSASSLPRPGLNGIRLYQRIFPL